MNETEERWCREAKRKIDERQALLGENARLRSELETERGHRQQDNKESRDEIAGLRELVALSLRRMEIYQMEVDSEAPHHHRQFMDLLRAELEGGGDVSRGLRTILAKLVKTSTDFVKLYRDNYCDSIGIVDLEAVIDEAEEAL